MPIILLEDTRQKPDKHRLKNDWWRAHGVIVSRHKLESGDYMSFDTETGQYHKMVTVDTKKGLAEMSGNINRGHARFKRENERARNRGLQIVYLIEEPNGKFRDITSVARWCNPVCLRCGARKRCNPRDKHLKCMRYKTVKPIQGLQLSRAMQTIQERYEWVRFQLCSPRDTARIICDALDVPYD